MPLPLLAALSMAAAVQATSAPVAPAAATRPPVDYAAPSSWLCRPGRADACGAAPLDAVRIAPDGARSPAPYKAAVDPPVDCFYVYPTVSRDQAAYSDMTPGPEELGVAAAQFARFGAVCRPFAPLYRQLTLYGLDQALGAHGADRLDLWLPAYEDVRAAWRAYLARDNGGRGVVLIGHSQGSILLQRLLAEEIDAKPAQRLLVSAFLAGDPGLAVPPGARAGGTFKSIPLCADRAQTGCVYAWGSYAEGDAATPRRFGASPIPGDPAACVDPAAPAGGEARFTSYLKRPAEAPAADPSWVEVVGGFAGRCVTDAQGAVLRVKVTDAPHADLRRALLASVQSTPGWGLHQLDVNLVQGDMIAAVAAQGRAWMARGGRP